MGKKRAGDWTPHQHQPPAPPPGPRKICELRLARAKGERQQGQEAARARGSKGKKAIVDNPGGRLPLPPEKRGLGEA